MKQYLQFILLIPIYTFFCASIHGQLTANREGKPNPSFGSAGFAPLYPGLQVEPVAKPIRLADGTVFHFYSSFGRFMVGKQLPSGERDGTFGNDGIKFLQFPDNGIIRASAIQPDGKLLGAGFIYVDQSNPSEDFAVTRLTASGELDQTFGPGGTVRMDFAPSGSSIVSRDYAHSILIQPDGKIIVAGVADQFTASSNTPNTYAILARLNSDGSVDSSFGENGVSRKLLGTTYSQPQRSIFNASFQHDGKILGGFNVERENPKSAFIRISLMSSVTLFSRSKYSSSKVIFQFLFLLTKKYLFPSSITSPKKV